MRLELRTTASACVVGLLLVILSAAGCNQPLATPHGAAAEASPQDPVKVSIVHPERKSLRRVVGQPGTVLPFEGTDLYARVPGYVRKVHADIGQRVKGPKYNSSGELVEPGEVLAEIDVPEMVEEVAQKKALVRQAEAEVEQARKALAAAAATVAASEALVLEAKAGVSRGQALYDRWNSESTRLTALVRSGVIDAQTRDETQNQFRSAAASLEEVKARVVSAEAAVRKVQADQGKAAADVLAAQARVQVAEAEARRSQAMLTYATIRAPYDGVVTHRNVDTGDLVQPSGGKGDCLFTVARLDPVRVVISVPEADAGLVQEKAQTKLTIQAARGLSLETAVTRTSWCLEPGSRVLRAEIDLPNKDGRVRPGMYLYAHITGQLPDAWTLPVAAVVKQGDDVVCFLVEGGKAVRTPVQLGHSDGEFTQILRLQQSSSPPLWGEPTGNEAVSARAAGLTDGQPVATAPAGAK